ncbi:MAG: iron-containing alcohol dehydrogenase [Lachnospirales bacterium]
MNNFTFDMPTKLHFGKDSIENLRTIKNYGEKVLIHYGKSSIKNNGVYDKVIKILTEENIEFYELGGVEANPSLSIAQQGIEICKEKNIDIILAVGGGSVIDSAKAVAIGSTNTEDVWTFYNGATPKNLPLPICVILTIPATGSETSPVSVLVDKDTKQKKSISYPTLRAKFSILDPEFTYSLPPHQISCGVIDIFAHLFERYFTPTKDVEFSDRLLEGAMIAVVQNGLPTLKNPTNYKYRSEIMLAGALAHNDTLSMGRVGDWGVHALEKVVSGYYDNAHGEGLSCIIPAWLKVAQKQEPQRFVQFFDRVFGIRYNNENQEQAIEAGIIAVESFFKSLNVATRFSETDKIKITEEHIKIIAKENADVGAFFKLTEEEIISVLTKAM